MNRRTLILFTLFTAVVLASIHADDFSLAKLPSFTHNFDLTKASDSGRNTFYKFIHQTLAPEMESLAPSAGKCQTNKPLNKDWEWQFDSMTTITTFTKIFRKALKVAVAMVGRVDKLETGQTRCIWTILRLSSLRRIKMISKTFTRRSIQLLGACDAHGLAALTNNYDSKTSTGVPTQRVATNFLAIYTAEEDPGDSGSQELG